MRLRAAAVAMIAVAAAVGLDRHAQPAPAAVGSVVMVGDSLTVGTAPHLRRELAGTPFTSDGLTGRSSTEAVRILRARDSGQRVVVFDAGVNDDPAQPSRLSTDLAAARSIAAGRCLVVATMVRPPYNGVRIDGLNNAVRQFASATPTARLVDWHGEAQANPRLITSDRVHPTPAGYAYRARLFARAIESCGASGGAPPASGGLPPPGTPPPRGRRPRDAPPGDDDRPREREPQPPAPRLGDQGPVLLDEPVSIQSRGAKLSGELLAPAGEGRHPAVVMIHGSGSATRESFREQAEYLAGRGVAALIYDKRGSGDSTGDPDYRYAELVDDVRAAVALLRSRPEVRPDGIGLWGFSEGGGWVAPTVAAGNSDVKAVVAVAAPGVAPVTQRDWEVRNGLDAGNAGAGTGAVSRYYAVAADFGDAGLVDSRAADLRFDPMPAWRRVAQPVLAVWGTNDEVVPVRNSAEALRSALVDGGANRDRTFRTFPGATHLLGVASESNRPGSAPGFLELSASWLRQRLGPEGPPAPVVSTPLPPADGEPPTLEVQRASLLERWPVQLAWLLLPALALIALSVRGWRRRAAPTASWWWLAAVAALDVAALGALAVAVVSIVDADGRDVEAVAGIPAVLLVAWLFTLAGLVATGLLARRLRRSRGPGVGVVLASSAWLLLALYWLV